MGIAGPDPDLSWARGQGGRLGPLVGPGQSPGEGGVLGGEAPRRKTIFYVRDAFGGLSFIAFCEFLAVFFSLITNNTLKISYDHVIDTEIFLNPENE